jgi:hypothetical protein
MNVPRVNETFDLNIVNTQAYFLLSLKPFHGAYFLNVKIWKGVHNDSIFDIRLGIFGKLFSEIHVNRRLFGKVKEISVDILLAVTVPKVYLAD